MRSSLPFVGVLVSSLTVWGSSPLEQEIPRRPPEPFTVFVWADTDTLSESGYSVDKLIGEASRQIRGRKNWMFLTEDPDKAEIFVQIEGHRVVSQLVTTQEKRVIPGRSGITPGSDRVGGERITVEYVDRAYVSEQHYLRAGVRGMGFDHRMTGRDVTRRGDLKGAASDLAKQLEEFLKINYQELAKRRRQEAGFPMRLARFAPPHSGDGGTAALAEIVDAPDRGLAFYRKWIGAYRDGNFIGAARELCSFPPTVLHAWGKRFLAAHPPDGELGAAALVHTECVLSLRKTPSLHLETALRYAATLREPGARADFQRRWYLLAGYFLHSELRMPEAIALLSSGLRLFPGDPGLSYALASALECWGYLHHEEDAFRSAEEILAGLGDGEASFSDRDVRLAHVLLRLGRLDEAGQRLERALGRPDLAEARLPAWLFLGEIHWRHARWPEARRAFESAREIDPSCQTATVALGVAHHRTADRPAAQSLAARWLETPVESQAESDLWWRYLLGRSSEYEKILDKLRAKTRR